MKSCFFPSLLLILATQLASAREWHVAGAGSDTNDGKTTATAFRSLQHAADLVQPGDVVLVGDGTYTSTDVRDGSAVLALRSSGRPDAWITWKAVPGQYPIVRPVGWAGILVTGSYQVLDGLTVLGGNDELVLAHAQEDAKKPTPDPRYNTNGIFVNGRSRQPTEKPHHVIIRHCAVGKCGGGGITAIEADYITIEDCQVFDNAWYMRYAGSGITTLNNWAFDDAPGYHIVVQRNYVWNNKTLVPWERTGKLSDGNGILLDVTDQELVAQGATNPNGDAVVNPNVDAVVKPTAPASEKPKRPEWKGRALIANNVSVNNGGSGIHVFRTRHVDIINNTTYGNGQTVGYEEIFANRSEDVVILNNIMVPRPGGRVTSNNKNTNLRWDYNLYPTAQSAVVGPHDLVADPHFIDCQPDPTKGNFRLAKGSPAHNSASDELPQTTDLVGKARPKSTRDRGAFEQ